MRCQRAVTIGVASSKTIRWMHMPVKIKTDLWHTDVNIMYVPNTWYSFCFTFVKMDSLFASYVYDLYVPFGENMGLWAAVLVLTNENAGMFVDGVLKHLVTVTNCVQINAYLGWRNGPQIQFSWLTILEQNTFENNFCHSLFKEKNSVNYYIPTSCKISLTWALELLDSKDLIY